MSNTYRQPTDWDFDESKSTRDRKKFHKPNSKFKQGQKQRRKAKERQAFRSGKEVIPEFPKSDVWEWL